MLSFKTLDWLANGCLVDNCNFNFCKLNIGMSVAVVVSHHFKIDCLF